MPYCFRYKGTDVFYIRKKSEYLSSSTSFYHLRFAMPTMSKARGKPLRCHWVGLWRSFSHEWSEDYFPENAMRFLQIVNAIHFLQIFRPRLAGSPL
jgi:hypothetical protein